MNREDDVWIQARLHAQYQRHKNGSNPIAVEALEYLRELHWKQVRTSIAQEIEALIVLTPPVGQAEHNHGAKTVYDKYTTRKSR